MWAYLQYSCGGYNILTMSMWWIWQIAAYEGRKSPNALDCHVYFVFTKGTPVIEYPNGWVCEAHMYLVLTMISITYLP